MDNVTLDKLLTKSFEFHDNFPYLQFEEDGWILALDYLPTKDNYYSVICAAISNGTFSKNRSEYYYVQDCFYNKKKQIFGLFRANDIVLYWKESE